MTADKLARALGGAFRAVAPTKKGLVQIEHVPSQTLFVAIPGGTFEMGPTKPELQALAKRAPVCGELAEKVLGNAGWTIDGDHPNAGITRLAPAEASKLARAFAKDGLRLVTDPEWEWLAREGGATLFVNGRDAKAAERACAALYRAPRFAQNAGPPASNGFGVWGLPWGDFVAEASGTRRAPWGVRGGAAMLYPWQSDEILMCAASFAYRIGKSKEKSGVRFAIDMP